MPGDTQSIGTVEAVTGLRKANRSLDFSAKYPEYHVIIASKTSTMHMGHTTQHDYFLGEGFQLLEQLPNPDKVVMGESWENYRERKQISLDIHRSNVGSTGVKRVSEGSDVRTVQVRTELSGEG